MNKNTQVETTQESQATNKNIGKVKTLKSAQERKKVREEQYRNFRINSLRRRCKRMGLSDEKIEELVKKLIEQMNAPKEYDILVMVNPKNMAMLLEAMAKANIQYRYKGDTFVSIGGDQNVLAKIREIAPPGAKIFPYAKKMESVIPKQEPSEKKPSNNNKNVAAKAKKARKDLNKNVRAIHKKHAGKAVAKQKKRIKLLELKKKRKATTIQMMAKKSSKGSKKASTNLKKAA